MMHDMSRNDEFAELDVSEDEFDHMFEVGEKVDIGGGVRTTPLGGFVPSVAKSTFNAQPVSAHVWRPWRSSFVFTDMTGESRREPIPTTP